MIHDQCKYRTKMSKRMCPYIVIAKHPGKVFKDKIARD